MTLRSAFLIIIIVLPTILQILHNDGRECTNMLFYITTSTTTGGEIVYGQGSIYRPVYLYKLVKCRSIDVRLYVRFDDRLILR